MSTKKTAKKAAKKTVKKTVKKRSIHTSTPAERKKLDSSVKKACKTKSGVNLSEISEKTGEEYARIRGALMRLRREGEVRTEGEKRACRYFAK